MPGQKREHGRRAERVRGDMHGGQVQALVLQLRLADQLLVDLDFFGQAQVVRDAHHKDAVNHRLVFFVAEVGVVLVFVGVGQAQPSRRR